MGQHSFLEATRQTTKFFTGLGLFVSIGILLVWSFLYADLTDLAVYLILSMVAAVCAVGVWLCLAIRCPRCRARIVWVAVREHPIGGWLSWLLTLSICPVCNFDPR